MSENFGATDDPKSISTLGGGLGGGPPNDELADHDKRIALANSNDSGVTVIGGFFYYKGEEDPANGYKRGYIGHAREHGYSHFAIGEVPGNSIFKNEERAWAMNKFFLDHQIAKGDVFEIAPGREGYWTAREKQHLEDNGYVERDGRYYPSKK